jgi:hypothetical protein
MQTSWNEVFRHVAAGLEARADTCLEPWPSLPSEAGGGKKMML